MQTRNAAGRPSLRSAVDALGDVVRVIADPSMLATSMAETFRKMVSVDRCAIFFPSGRDEFRVGCWSGQADYTPHLRHLITGKDPFTAEILQRNAPVVIPDSRTDWRVADELDTTLRCNVRSMVGVPIFSGAVPVAIAYLDDEGSATRFSSAQLDTAREFAMLCGLVLGQRERPDSVARARETGLALARRTQLLSEDLGKLAYRNASLAEFASLIADALNRPVSIYDSEWRRVAHGQPPRCLRRPAGELSDPSVRAHPRVEEAIAHVTAGKAQMLPPLPALGLDLRSLVTPIPLGATTWGGLAVFEAGRPFDEYDNHVTSVAALRVALALSTAHLSHRTTEELREAFVVDLFRGAMAAEAIPRRAEAVGLRDGPHAVCVVGTSGPQTSARTARTLLEHLPSATALVATAEIDGWLACLLPLPTGPEPGRAAVEALRDNLASVVSASSNYGRTMAGISTPAKDLAHCERAYRDARQVVLTLQRFDNPHLPRVVSADEIGGGLALLSTAQVDEMRVFAQDKLGPLHTASRHADLLATVHTFLRTGNVLRCAHVLGVHENTIRYRLTKIEELTGLALVGDPDAQVQASLALLVLRLTGECDWNIGLPK
ncbi:helix-turn-helix domain-containing protein [Saccharopolyspora sp. ASAGF58]|uniref:helix-turn-helix domain-containing protein n=1 Tax=Saccharopolyspora sp. ASAGF58 TaxID=2719023 RepID=UPI00144525DD|nr:helix-turn-helix domain-containing protein [Saccharopolyspora sp. ASAGF58]